MSHGKFDGKSVIVTGASAGVGAAVARAFAEAGAQVMLVARRRDPLRALTDELAKTTRVCFMAMDVADTESCRDLFKKARYEFGAVHFLVNNAGMHARGPLASVDIDQLAQMIDVNLRAPVVLTRLAIDEIKDCGGGAIVNVASLAGCTPVPGSATYGASKFGLRAFTLAVAEELRGTDVRIGAVSPGPIDTGFIMDDIDGVSDITFSQPMSTAAEVAAAVLRVAAGDATEIKMPAFSGRLATAGYLFPALSRWLRPRLERRGRKAKAFYKAKYQRE